MTNTAKQSVTRTLRIQVLPQNDGIRNRLRLWQRGLMLIGTNKSRSSRKKIGVWEAFKTNPNIATSKDFKSYSVSASGVVTITYKDNTTNDVTAPVGKRLAAPTVKRDY